MDVPSLSQSLSLDSDGSQSLIANMLLLQVVQFSVLASFTIAVFEILATLPDEVALVWPDKMSPMKVIYLVNKYSVLVDTLLGIIIGIWKPRDPQSCRIQFTIMAYTPLIGFLLSELILVMRTMALWGYDRRVVVLLSAAFLEIAGFEIFVVHETVTWAASPTHVELQRAGCLLTTQDRDTWPAYAWLVMGETAIVFLTFLRHHLDRDGGIQKYALIRTMYRDGLFFYVVVLALSLTNLAVMIFAPEGLTPFMQMPLRVVHSALCTRVLLNLRRAAARPASGMSVSMEGHCAHSTTLVFDVAAGAPTPSAPDHSAWLSAGWEEGSESDIESQSG